MPESDVTKMKVADLKRELKLRGLPLNGNKNELQDRLQTALLEGDISLEDSAIADAIDDDVSLTDEDENKLLGDENEEEELLKSPVSTPTTTTVPDLLADDKPTVTAATPAASAKKVVLKRNNSQQSVGAVATTGSTTAKENAVPSSDAAAASTDSTEVSPAKKHKPIVVGNRPEGTKPAVDKKLSELTPQERLELRAKKFGITPAPAASPAAAGAAAVNKSSSASITDNKGNKETDEQQKEALKRRAERFGNIVPEKAPKTLAEERLQKRKERFGAEAKAAPADQAADKDKPADSKDVWSEKARARLERFKTTPEATAAATK
ncbi:uncharacterized protein Dana_GF18934 [Drosophila ananassae]|uniref:SAP domain-containing protein n=1 Tax=Drosophila ananassae TaxID=7217 RepID=B3M183_DROAN|nr:uncharacterized protein LOC6501699 [Drosophila ananassae]EDV44353.2 uncharacterized protein Dana_GF18934 [Drosophila ananassae]